MFEEDGLEGAFVVDFDFGERYRDRRGLGGGGDRELGGDRVADVDLRGGEGVGCGHCWLAGTSDS